MQHTRIELVISTLAKSYVTYYTYAALKLVVPRGFEPTNNRFKICGVTVTLWNNYKMVSPAGFEPASHSYQPCAKTYSAIGTLKVDLEVRFELTVLYAILQVWCFRPLSYSRIKKMEEDMRIELKGFLRPPSV